VLRPNAARTRSDTSGARCFSIKSKELPLVLGRDPALALGQLNIQSMQNTTISTSSSPTPNRAALITQQRPADLGQRQPPKTSSTGIAFLPGAEICVAMGVVALLAGVFRLLFVGLMLKFLGRIYCANSTTKIQFAQRTHPTANRPYRKPKHSEMRERSSCTSSVSRV
jgi:hypothetical protein